MRLDFNVLWVEDQPTNVGASRDKIERSIRKHGFRLQTVFAKSIVDAKGYLSSDIYGDHIDLVLMDFDLGGGAGGDDGLVEVRGAFPYKDIVFYSARAADLKKLVAAKEIQGIYCSDRLSLPDAVEGMFETLVKKVLDIDHSRGIVMGSSSDIDGLILQCLAAKAAGRDGMLSEIAKGLVAERIVTIREKLDENLRKLEVAASLDELESLHLLYTSAERVLLLRKILGKDGDKYKDHCQDLINYTNNIVPGRNVLAHVRVHRDGFSRKLYNRKGAEITADMVRDMRQALLKHQESLEELASLLSAKS